MNAENLHRLLRRQLKKANLSNEQTKVLLPFLDSIDDAYKSFDKDLKHLENVLEVNSKELYKANEQLKIENQKKHKEASDAKTSLMKIVNNVTDIIIELDSNGKFIYLNPAWEKFAEESPEASLGKSYMDFSSRIKSFDTDINQKIIDRDFEKFKTVFSRYDKSGKLKWWELSTKLITSSDGKIERVIASLIDVTSLKETEKKLIKANQSKSRFLSTMSHEIRTPLNAVIAISNILLMEDPKLTQIENLKTLKYSSKHLLHLINDILDYNKLMSGKLKFDNSQFDLIKELRHTVNSMSYNAKAKGLKLNYTIDEAIPQYVKGDSHRLSQVVTNLVSNAIKFTSHGSIDVELTLIEQKNDKAEIKFEVSDTGIGIEPAKQNMIFDRFTQAESDTTKKFGGTGLGLAICKKIINLHESKINIESELGKGTKFYFNLTFDIVNKPNEVVDISKDIADLNLEGVKVLVVDDNDINLMVVKQFLDKWKVRYDDAKDGGQAIEKIKKNKYDLILLDLQMPVMDGFTVTNKVRQMNNPYFKKLPIIALSASVSSNITDRVIDAGMNDYLCKPFNPEVLFQKLKYYCENKILVKAQN